MRLSVREARQDDPFSQTDGLSIYRAPFADDSRQGRKRNFDVGRRYDYDVFLSYTQPDLAVANDVASRLRDRGVRVWFDRWDMPQNATTRRLQAKARAAMRRCTAMVLLVSRDALADPGWTELVNQTYDFRYPSDGQRRFIPIGLDDVLPGSPLNQVLLMDWRKRGEEDLESLLDACMAAQVEPQGWIPETAPAHHISLGHVAGIRALAYSPDGQRAASGSDDGTVRIWNLRSGICERVLEGQLVPVISLAYNLSGDRLLAGSADSTVRVWNLETWECDRVLSGHTHEVTGVAYHPDGNRAISVSKDHTIRVWDIDAGVCRQVFPVRRARGINAIASHPSGERALIGCGDGSVRVVDLADGKSEIELGEHKGGVLCVAYHPDGVRAISGSIDHTMRLWDLEEKKCDRVFSGHERHVWGVAPHPDGIHAISCAGDRTLRVWNLDSGECDQILKIHNSGVRAVAYSPGGGCSISGSSDGTINVWDFVRGESDQCFAAHPRAVEGVAFSSDCKGAITASSSGSTQHVRVWDLADGSCRQAISRKAKFEDMHGSEAPNNALACGVGGKQVIDCSYGNRARVWELADAEGTRFLEGSDVSLHTLAYHPDGYEVIGGFVSGPICVWNLADGKLAQRLEGHATGVMSIAYHPDGKHAISGCGDGTIRVWNLAGKGRSYALRGHTAPVLSVAYHPDGAHAISGSVDGTVRVWDLTARRCVQVLEGHTEAVRSVAYHPDGAHAISGSEDCTVRVWNLQTDACRVLEGHADIVLGVACDPDGEAIISAAANGVLRIWSLPLIDQDQPRDQARYTNAKVVLVGDSQVGKSGLAMRLARDHWELTESTIGAWATQVKLPMSAAESTGKDIERDIWLWDFGGQADQRLVHQLYIDDAALALVVFDGEREDALTKLWDWVRALHAVADDTPKILIAGRVDCNRVRLSPNAIERFSKDAGFLTYIATSAKNDIGCSELREKIVTSIDWEHIPWRASPQVFQRLKGAILELKDSGRALTSIKELRDWLPTQIGPFKPAELDAVLGLLAGPGAVRRLRFGEQVLLQPELLNSYAQCVIQSLQDGCIAEDLVLNGELSYPPDFVRLPEEVERTVLRAMHQQLVEESICIRDHEEEEGRGKNKRPTLLVFPGYFRREHPVRPTAPLPFITFRFTGYLDEIYASLIVRLHHTKPFERLELWHNAADMITREGWVLGVRLTTKPDGIGELDLYCDADTPVGEQALFARYVQDYLAETATDLGSLRTYICPYCKTPVANREVANRRLEEGKLNNIICSNCELRIPLHDDIQRQLASLQTGTLAQRRRKDAEIDLRNENREQILKGTVTTLVAEAGQTTRIPENDHGIDAELEFFNDDGAATGKKLYMQLKSGDSHLYVRKGNERVFRIRKPRHADFWADQIVPVYLVIMSSQGSTEWMEIRDLLIKQRAAERDWPAREIVFDGEPFTVPSIREVRAQMLGC